MQHKTKGEIMEKLLQEQVDKKLIFGGSVLVSTLDGSRNIGFSAGHTAANELYKFDSQTIVDMASVTKAAATVTALLICIERGLVDPERSFADYLPQLRYKLAEKVSVADLANHLSGFGNIPGINHYPYFAETGAEMVENILNMAPIYPRGKFEYACWNYLLLCMIVEEVTQQKFPDFCRREIFDVLNMTSSSLGAPASSDPALLAHTFNTPQAGMISDRVAHRFYSGGFSAGNAGMFSTIEDMAKLLRCYLRHGASENNNRLFSSKVFDLLLPQGALPTISNRTFGWIVCDEIFPDSITGKTLMHSGWSGQTIWLDTQNDLFAIILTARCGDYDQAKSGRFQILKQAIQALRC